MRGAGLRAVPAWLWFTGAALLVYFLLAATSLPSAWAAREEHGVRGTWVATTTQCYRGCRTVGDFHPSNGGPVRHKVDLSGTGEQPIGSRHAAIDTGSWNEEVFAPGDGRKFTKMAWTSGVSAALLAVWSAVVERRIRGERRS